jgi:hypothetical protein
MVPISLVPALALMYFYISTFRSMCNNNDNNNNNNYCYYHLPPAEIQNKGMTSRAYIGLCVCVYTYHMRDL